MPKYNIVLDEKVSVWQTVRVVIDAQDEIELKAILQHGLALDSALRNGKADYDGYVDTFHETTDHLEWDTGTAEIERVEEIANA